MKAKLVKVLFDDRVRVYEISEPIYKGKSDIAGETNINKLFEDLYKRLKPEFVESAQKYRKDGCYYIVISDAHTHIERLAFPGIKVADGEYAWSHGDIEGKHTFMIDGGDPDSVYPDEVYIRRLAQLNNLTYEGLID